MFKFLGMLVALYTVYSVAIGSVYAKSGPGGGMVSKQESPEYFWMVIAIYIFLSLALLVYF